MIYDVIIIGGGPAGATAGIYCARAGKSTLLIEKDIIGGKITESPDVRNIPGIRRISGADFGEDMNNQLLDSGVSIEFETVENISVNDEAQIVSVKCEDIDEPFTSKTLIIASGTKNRLLGLPDEESLIGRGISFCVTCDGMFYKDKEVAVIGGGNSAVTEALELSKICKRVYIVQNLPTLTADESLLNDLNKCNNVDIIVNTTVKSYNIKTYDDMRIKRVLDSITLEPSKRKLSVDGVFIAIGVIPQTELFKDIVSFDDIGYIKTDINGVTVRNNVFACGDCVCGTIKQVASACGSGVTASMSAIKYLKG